MTKAVLICSSDDRAAWLAARKAGIGASECAALIDAHPYMSRAELYAQKLGFETRDEDDLEPEFLFWGSVLEPAIINGYSKRTGREARRHGVLARHPEHEWMLATLDAETLIDETVATSDQVAAVWAPLEVKNVTGFKIEDWTGGVPFHHRCQSQWQQVVTGAAVGSVAALIGGNRLVWDDVPRDEILQRRLFYAAEVFRAQLATGKLPPDCFDGHAGTRRALQAMHPADNGLTITLDGELIAVADELEQLKLTAKSIKDRVTVCENNIKAALGDATRGELANGVSYSWKQQLRAAFTVAESTTRVLRRHEPKQTKSKKQGGE